MTAERHFLRADNDKFTIKLTDDTIFNSIETRIIYLTLEGYKQREIAHILEFNQSYIRNQTSNICGKVLRVTELPSHRLMGAIGIMFRRGILIQLPIEEHE